MPFSPSQLVRLVLVSVGVAFAASCLGRAQALRAAGLYGPPPPNAAAIEKFIDSITDNALWIIGTVTVLALVVIGGLFFFGHSRAADFAMRIGIGAFVIVSAPGIAA